MRKAALWIPAVVVTALATACGGDPSPGELQCDASAPAEISAEAPRLMAAPDAPPKRWIVEMGDPSEAGDTGRSVEALEGSAPTRDAAASASPGDDADRASSAGRLAPPAHGAAPVTAQSLRDAEIIERAGGQVLHAVGRRQIAAVLSEAEVETLKADPAVKHIEEDPPRFPLSSSSGQQLPWGMSAIGATEAWSMAAPVRRGAKVCIIDSGLYAAHGDLSPGGGALDGYPSDVWREDTCGHGTHVAGTIAALDNDTGVVGANPLGADLFMVRVFGGDDCGWTYGSELADAIDRCVSAGAKVINMSLGGFSPSSLERDAINAAWRSGAVIVAAAGNEGDTELEYPASYPAVISVGAVDEELHLTAFSQRNPQVDLVAPGAAVLSTVPFVSRHELSVDGLTVAGAPLEGAAETDHVSGPLVDGGDCTADGAWSGAIVLCRRGGNTFAEKIAHAQRGGAIGAVVFNNVSGGFSGTLGEKGAGIPAISVSAEDGAALRSHLGARATLVNELRRAGSGYASYSGTSMAAPHVAGVASFLLGQIPQSTNAQIRAALLVSARDLGPPGIDHDTGSGLLQADAALAALRAGAFDAQTPLAGFLADCEGLRCTFTDASVASDGSLVSRQFDFGDGRTQPASAERTPHTFSKAGTFTVTLTVTDQDGRVGKSAVPISVIAATARAGAIASDGSRPVQLDWSGIKTASVLILRDGKSAGVTLNSGAVIDTLKNGARAATYRVCSAGGESCSEALTVLPPCG